MCILPSIDSPLQKQHTKQLLIPDETLPWKYTCHMQNRVNIIISDMLHFGHFGGNIQYYLFLYIHTYSIICLGKSHLIFMGDLKNWQKRLPPTFCRTKSVLCPEMYNIMYDIFALKIACFSGMPK